MEPTCGSLPEQRTIGRSMVPGKWDSGIYYFFWQKKVFQALKEVQEVTFAEVPIIEHSQLSGHIVAAMEVSGVRIQVYEGADGATLQAILQAAKSC